MGLTVPGLKRAYNVRKWQNIFQNHPYIAVIQLTGGRSWGRINMRARVLGEHVKAVGEDEAVRPFVDARYAVPWSARTAASRTSFPGLQNLFRSAPSAVIYGADVGVVLDVVGRAQEILDGALLVGGRFGRDVVHGSAWRDAAALESEDKVRVGLLQVLDQAAPSLVQVLDSGNQQLVRTVDTAGGAAKLISVVDAAKDRMDEVPQ